MNSLHYNLHHHLRLLYLYHDKFHCLFWALLEIESLDNNLKNDLLERKRNKIIELVFKLVGSVSLVSLVRELVIYKLLITINMY